MLWSRITNLISLQERQDIYSHIQMQLSSTDPSHKSHNASGKYMYLSMHIFVTEMSTFLLQNVAL